VWLTVASGYRDIGAGTNVIRFCVTLVRSTDTENGSDVTYDLVTIAAVNTSTGGHLDGATVTKLNFWIHAVLIKMVPCLLLTLFVCLLVSTVRASQRRALRLRARCSVGGANLSKAANRRLMERNRTTVRYAQSPPGWVKYCCRN